jgi:hypothetical protein
VNRVEMFGRVSNFGASYSDQFPEATVGGRMFAAVSKAQSRLEALAAAQASSERAVSGSTASKALAKAALLGTLEAMSRTADALSLDDPAIGAEFRLPRQPNSKTLLALARAILDRATPLAAQFVEHGMRPDFLKELEVHIQNFQHAAGERTISVKNRVDATAEIEENIVLGLQAVARLDAIVRNICANDAEALRRWDWASRVEHPPRAKPVQTAGSSTASPSSTVSATQ